MKPIPSNKYWLEVYCAAEKVGKIRRQVRTSRIGVKHVGVICVNGTLRMCAGEKGSAPEKVSGNGREESCDQTQSNQECRPGIGLRGPLFCMLL